MSVVRWLGVLAVLLLLAVMAAQIRALLRVYNKNSRPVVITHEMTPSKPQNPWSTEPISEPVTPESLIQNATVETYSLNGNTPEDLESSLAALGPGSLGNEAQTSYQLVLYKGSPADKRCGYSTARVSADITVTLPRWVAMPNATDDAKQWWSWKIKQLAAMEKDHIAAAIQEAQDATQSLSGADCTTGDAAFTDFNNRLRGIHPMVAYPADGSDVAFRTPGSIVEGTPPKAIASMPAGSGQTPTTGGAGRETVPAALWALPLVGTDGRRTDLNSQRGHVILINFWATWCGPCRAEMPSLVHLVDQMKSQDVFFAFVSEESAQVIQGYLERSHIQLPTYTANSKALNINAIPVTYVISKAGDIVLKRTGSGQWDSPDIVKFLSDQIYK